MVGVVVLEKLIGPPSIRKSVHHVFRVSYRAPSVARNAPGIAILVREKRGYREGKEHVVACQTEQIAESLIVGLCPGGNILVVVRIALYGSVGHKVEFYIFESPFFELLELICHAFFYGRMGGVDTVPALFVGLPVYIQEAVFIPVSVLSSFYIGVAIVSPI